MTTLRLSLTLCFCVLFLGLSVSAAKPNIILMMADDMGMGDTSAFQDFTGNADDVQVHTPQMERLARMGMRFTDAHTPSSRCSPTRYGLLTGRYPWRNRLKHWVLFGSQGDPMIEADRPTIASMLKDNGYGTAMFGKWHVGLRYRRSDGTPAAGWEDADLLQPLHTSPLDHGFDVARYTSRSHKSSGPDIVKGKTKNFRGPGHLDGRIAVGATGVGKELDVEGPNAYVLTELGSRHSDNAIDFIEDHVSGSDTKNAPFFLYYPANSNHGPHTPDTDIGGVPVVGAARTKSGKPTTNRHDYIYENDVALGRMIDWLVSTEDPRNPRSKLIENTIVIFTSDNGAEIGDNVATGPFRSNKASSYEGGHRVPFIVAWPKGGVGDGNGETGGLTSPALIGLQDLYATFAEVVGAEMPDHRAGQKGAEDSYSVLSAFTGASLSGRPPLFFHDHKEAKDDPAVSVIRVDSPKVSGKSYSGQWKLFFDATLLRLGEANPYELYDLATDQWEANNLIEQADLQSLIGYMTDLALLHRNSGGHRLARFAPEERVVFNLKSNHSVVGKSGKGATLKAPGSSLKMTIQGASGGRMFHQKALVSDEQGLGIKSSGSEDVDANEAVLIRFNRDVIVDSASLFAGDGVCGGFYQVGDAAPLSIYCVDADIDDKDQSGILSDLGVLKAGEVLRLDSRARFESEATGQWRLQALAVRVLD